MDKQNKVAVASGCLASAVVFFITTILPILIAGGVLWLIFGRN